MCFKLVDHWDYTRQSRMEDELALLVLTARQMCQ